MLRLESQVKIEFALESTNNFQRSKATSQSVKLSADCLELAQNELLMMDYNFNFQAKFADYEQYRLTQKRKKKNSVIIVNKETAIAHAKIQEKKSNKT